MNTYKVRSGDMLQIVHAKPGTKPEEIAKRAFASTKVDDLAVLAIVYGGEFGDDEDSDSAVYVSTERCLRELGLME